MRVTGNCSGYRCCVVSLGFVRISEFLEVKKLSTVDCPECSSSVDIQPSPSLGDIVDCDDCGTDLEIVGLDPLELETIEEEFYDDDEEDDEY